MISPRGWHFWLCSILQKELTTSHEQDTARTWRWSWRTSCITEIKTDCIGKVREVATDWWLASPPGQHSIMWRGLSWAYGSSSGKRQGRGTFQPLPSVLGHFMGAHILVSPTRIAGESMGLNHGKSDYDREGGGFSKDQSAEPSWWYIMNRELSGV